MLTTATRASLATALSAVPGVQGYAYRPTTVRAGDAWPRLGNIERAVADAFEASWLIYVVLSPDEKKASEQTDELLPDLVDAIDAVAFVDGVSFVVINTGAGDMFALEIRARGE